MLDSLGSLAGWAVVGALLVGLDAIVGRFKAARSAWKGCVVVAQYLRDLFLGPVKVRRLEKWRGEFSVQVEPVHHLGAVWFMADVDPDRCDAYCETCWSEGKRTSLDVRGMDNPDARMVLVVCRRNPAGHLRDHNGQHMHVPREAWIEATRHAYDRRSGKS